MLTDDVSILCVKVEALLQMLEPGSQLDSGTTSLQCVMSLSKMVVLPGSFSEQVCPWGCSESCTWSCLPFLTLFPVWSCCQDALLHLDFVSHTPKDYAAKSLKPWTQRTLQLMNCFVRRLLPAANRASEDCAKLRSGRHRGPWLSGFWYNHVSGERSHTLFCLI